MNFWRTKSKTKTKTKRIAFDIEKETLEQIDELVKKTGCTGRADLFRDSLRLFSWWTEKQDEGYEVVLRKDGESTVIELKRTE